MNKEITVLIPTSPIPSHPDIKILEETIENIRKYTDGEIILLVDGIHKSVEHRSDNYQEYLWRILEFANAGKYGAFRSKLFSEHTHQAEMTRTAVNFLVKTPLVLFCEHDTSPIGDIPFKELCYLVENDSFINYVRFNIFHAILQEHQYLMLDKKPVVINDVPLIRTLQWSQRPHIAKTSWYIDILNKYFNGSRTMIEDVMHSIVIESYKKCKHDIFGLSIYAPPGNQLRSYHSDGRKEDEKIING